MLLPIRHISTSLAIISSVSAQYVPDTNNEIIRELEHIFLDGGSGALVNAVSPCTNYEDPSTGSPSNNQGRQSAAEWIRTAFRKLGLYSCLLDLYRAKMSSLSVVVNS